METESILALVQTKQALCLTRLRGGVEMSSQVIHVLRSLFYLKTNRMEGTPEQECPPLLVSESRDQEPPRFSPALSH